MRGHKIAATSQLKSNKGIFWTKFMWLEKLSLGVLRLMTPLGPRYLKPSFGQRLYLIWVFRHFPTLPLKVLSKRQQRLIETLCEQNRFVIGIGVDDAPLLGTLEQRPPVPSGTSSRRPNASVADTVRPFAAEARRQ
jgi:hypothetical protein